MTALQVLRAGLQTTLQDTGRPGWRHIGVPISGAMDLLHARLANRLVGNPDSAAVLEMTLSGDELLVLEDVVIAVTGADLQPEVENEEQLRPLPQHRPVLVRRGSRLRFGRARRGCRACLAVSGGFSGPLVLGS